MAGITEATKPASAKGSSQDSRINEVFACKENLHIGYPAAVLNHTPENFGHFLPRSAFLELLKFEPEEK